MFFIEALNVLPETDGLLSNIYSTAHRTLYSTIYRKNVLQNT